MADRKVPGFGKAIKLATLPPGPLEFLPMTSQS
jgi:hypothetical protein